MTNAMKMPFPKGAREVGSIEQSVSYPEGEKSYLITWKIPNARDSMAMSAGGKFVSQSFTVSDDDGIIITWCLALVRGKYQNQICNRCYYLFPCFMPENDCNEAFVKIELTYRVESSFKQYSCSFAEICTFDARDQNSSVSLCITDDLPSNFTAFCKIIQSDLPKFNLSKDFGNVLKNQNFTDVKLLPNDGTVFEAHKMVLSARSSVFAAMFAHQMKENVQHEIEIADMNGEVVEDMLRFIYTDKSEKLGLLTKDLFVAADKYDLKGLKKMSEDVLITNLSFSNAVEILLFSELHNATRLKTEVVKFITTKKNVKVFNTETWKCFEQTYLLKEICEAFAKR